MKVSMWCDRIDPLVQTWVGGSGLEAGRTLEQWLGLLCRADGDPCYTHPALFSCICVMVTRELTGQEHEKVRLCVVQSAYRRTFSGQ